MRKLTMGLVAVAWISLGGAGLAASTQAPGVAEPTERPGLCADAAAEGTPCEAVEMPALVFGPR